MTRKPLIASVPKMTNMQIITLAVFFVGGSTRSVDTEDVAIKANELAPGRFAWRKYKDQINLDAVRKRLWDAKKQFSFVTGSETAGWMLTPEGQSFAESNEKQVNQMNLSRVVLNENEKRWQNRERTRLVSSTAFSKYHSNPRPQISSAEAESFFRIDEYVTSETRRRKIDRIMNAFRNDKDIEPVMLFLATLLERRSGNAS